MNWHRKYEKSQKYIWASYYKLTTKKKDMNKEQKKELINEIVGILHKDAGTLYSKGSCGELGEAYLAITEDYFEDIAEDVCALIQAITDPENQPNQFGIDINARYCMPDEVVDEETHKQYLKDIGLNNN